MTSRTGAVVVGDEAHVAVGDDADQHAVGVDHRHAGDAVARRTARRPRAACRPGEQVTGLVTMPASDRFTRSTCSAWSSIDRLRCSTPMPPWRAIAIAIRASVTVSIALETSGIAQRDVAGQPGGGVDLARHDVGLARQQQHVVEGQAERRELRPGRSTSMAPHPLVGGRVTHRTGGRVERVPHRLRARGYREKVTRRAPRPVQRRPGRPGRRARRPRRTPTASTPLTPTERQDVLEDLADLEIYQALLAPRGAPRARHRVRGLPRAALLRLGPAARQPAPPARLGPAAGARAGLRPGPGPLRHWEYARGYADGVHDTPGGSSSPTASALLAHRPHLTSRGVFAA